MESIKTWNFNGKTKTPQELADILVPGESILECYAGLKDSLALTSKRILILDRQGFTGKRMETISIPYGSIAMWSLEHSDSIFDGGAEVKLWARQGLLSLKLDKGCSILEFNRLLGEKILR